MEKNSIASFSPYFCPLKLLPNIRTWNDETQIKIIQTTQIIPYSDMSHKAFLFAM